MGHGRPTDRRPRKFIDWRDGGDQGPGGSRHHLDSPGGSRRFQRAMWTGSRDPFGLRGSREPRGQLGNSKEPIHGPRELFGRPGRPQTAIWIAWETPETDADSPGGSRRATLDRLGGQPGRQRAGWAAARRHDSVSPGGPRWTTRAVWVAREAPESQLDCLGDSRDRRGGSALR